MSSVVNNNTRMNYPQPTMLHNNGASANQYRPSNNPPKNLSQSEIQCLYNILGNDCVTLATAVAQVLCSYNNSWSREACGVLCFVKDYTNRNYFFRLYNLQLKKFVFEEPAFASIRLEKSTDLFYVFDGMNFKVGFNFVDQIEAETFCNHFHTKQENRQNKKKLKESTNLQTNPIPFNGNPDMPKSVLNINKSEKKQTHSNDKKNKNHRPTKISSPILDSFSHVIHIGPNNSFITDDAQRKLFDQVLSTMTLSSDEKLYVKRMVANTKDGLVSLFKTTKRDCNTAYSNASNLTPNVAEPVLKQSDTNTKRSPHQDLSMPKIIFDRTNISDRKTSKTSENVTIIEQSKNPTIPISPPPDIPSRVEISSKIPPPRPPPLPVDLHIPQPKSNIPPPLPPNPMFESVPIKNDASMPISNSSHGALLQEIIDNSKNKLNQPLHKPKVTSVKESNTEVQRTLEENILEMIRERRLIIMGHENNIDSENAEKNDSDEDEW